MVLSIHQFQAHAALGGKLNVEGRGNQTRIVNSGTSWLGRAVAWVKNLLASEATRNAEATRNRVATRSFAETMRREFGEEIANQALQRAGVDLQAGRPLTARMVREAIDAAKHNRANMAVINNGTKTLHSSQGPIFDRLLDRLHPPVNSADLSASQKWLIDRLMAAEVDRLSDDNRHLVLMSDAELARAFAKVVAHVVNVGDVGATRAIETEQELSQRIGNFARDLASLPPITDQNLKTICKTFCDSLLQAKRVAEDLATLQGRRLDGAEATLALFQGPVQTALRNMDRGTLERIRVQLTNPQGMAVAFMEASLLDTEDTATGLATQRSRALLFALLEGVGTRLGRDTAERGQDMGRLQQPPAGRTSVMDAIDRHLQSRLIPDYDPATVSMAEVLDGQHPLLHEEFFEYLKDTHNDEYVDYFGALSALQNEPSMDGLEKLVHEQVNRNKLNINGQTEAAVHNRLQALIARQSGQGEQPAITDPSELRAAITEVLAPVTTALTRILDEDVVLRFRTMKQGHLQWRTPWPPAN